MFDNVGDLKAGAHVFDVRRGGGPRDPASTSTPPNQKGCRVHAPEHPVSTGSLRTVSAAIYTAGNTGQGKFVGLT